MGDFSVIGKSVIRKDALDKVLGKTKFSADIKLPAMLYAKVLRSKVPHALLKSIDVAAAKALPGVVAVLTAADVPGSNAHGIVIKDEPVLVYDKIRKIGDALAVVAAETEELAIQALGLINVEIEELPPVFDAEEAMRPDAPKVHGDSNILSLRKIRKGDVAAAFAGADIIIEQTYRTQMQEHAYIEPEAGVAYLDGDVVVIKASTQNTHFDCREVARNLAMPSNKVRVIQAPTGGGFGGKLDVSVQIFLALLAVRTKRPVQLVYTREESLVASPKRHPCTISYKTAADKNGKLLAIDVVAIADTGAYSSYGPAPVTRLAVHATGPYEVPHVRVDAYTIYTNNPTAGAMRGFGVPQIAFAYEQQMDMVAEKAGISPLAVRLINTLKENSVTATGQILETGGGIDSTLTAAYAKVQEHINGQARTDTVKRRGYGIGCMFYGIGNTGLPNPAGAYVDFLDDGTVNLMVGAADIGQGSNTIIAQIVAEELGISFDDIHVISADTGVTPDGGATSASRQTYISGNAALRAAREAKKIVLEVAAESFGVPAAQIVLKDGWVTVQGQQEQFRKTIKEILAACRSKGKMTIGHGWFNPTTTGLDNATGAGAPYEAYAFGSQAVEVEVDTETGQVEVLNIYAAHDVGKAVNPLQVEAQIEGGSIMGLGYGIYEDVKKDRGRIKTPSFATYLIPTSLDVPAVHSIIVEEPADTGPFGAKGLGETSLVPTAAAIANAVYDAVGIRVTELPVSPERVLRLLKASGNAIRQGNDRPV
ncbi:xanthine dehydrogenase family protein molybdopterin-binding subunit [Sporomusa sp.]|uniref:xanthine dehydrogenase family protein molybdopterin-binding subunit n=1 Tax=Sporomusa sp. TaxID=2078658 RepID=UPI002CDD9504|nr:xanthine dehydrogenase family protein molybdopterin-binding subunit [Sporomusa sp.]HWR06082.1 xanthine dehydrogenase family protein molybdopterin-binding subunit [Sporomusa sp.]